MSDLATPIAPSQRAAQYLPGAQLEAKPGGTSRLRVSLCLLVWNEIEGCKLDVPHLPLDQFDEVYAVDGGSKDGTAEWLTQRGIPVHVQKVRGYNGAMIEAFEQCTTDAVVLYHPKGSIDPQEVLLCKRELEQGADLTIGSRIMQGGANEEDAHLLKPRKWFVMALGMTGAVLWRRQGRYRRASADAKHQTIAMDVLHGFRGMRKDKFFAIEPLREPKGVTTDLEMVVRSYRKGFRVTEFPSREKPRPHGDTHFKAWPTGKKMLAYLWFELRRKG